MRCGSSAAGLVYAALGRRARKILLTGGKICGSCCTSAVVRSRWLQDSVRVRNSQTIRPFIWGRWSKPSDAHVNFSLHRSPPPNKGFLFDLCNTKYLNEFTAPEHLSFGASWLKSAGGLLLGLFFYLKPSTGTKRWAASFTRPTRIGARKSV